MKTILFVALGELHVTKGGIHRVTDCLMRSLSKVGYKCLYLISSFDERFYYIENKEDLNHQVYKDKVKNYIVEHNVDIIIDQMGFCSNSFAKLFESFKLKNISFITVFHNSPLIYEKTFTLKRSVYNFNNQNGLKNHIANALRILLFPLWKRHVVRGTSQLFKKNYEIADRCVMLSQKDIHELGRYIGQSHLTKCINIPNPLSLIEIKNDSIVNNKEKIVLIVSRLNNFEKRIDLAIKIWEKIEREDDLNDWSLYIVGEGIHEDNLKQLTAKLNLQNVKFEGRKSSEPYFDKASIFMMTSAIEGWGLTLTESMQSGVVPIAFNSYPALPEIITDGYDGFIIPENDIEAYSERLMQLMRNNPLRKEIAINGLESCHRFEMDKITNLWIDLFESL